MDVKVVMTIAKYGAPEGPDAAVSPSTGEVAAPASYDLRTESLAQFSVFPGPDHVVLVGAAKQWVPYAGPITKLTVQLDAPRLNPPVTVWTGGGGTPYASLAHAAAGAGEYFHTFLRWLGLAADASRGIVG